MCMFRRFITGLLDIVYPKKCLACKNKLEISSVDNLICPKCWGNIKRNLPPFCHSCGRRLEKSSITKNICPGCMRTRLHFDRAFSPCVYEGVIKELIHEFKYNNKDYLGPVFSRLLVEFIKEYNLPMDSLDFIVPVPLHKTRLREREFNQAEILSNSIAAEFKKIVLKDALSRNRHTKTQTDLAIDKRYSNVRGCFSVTRPESIRGKNLLLVDDVLTTAATCSEAAKALKESGANIVFVLTLAN
jgi:competence protein ComFC